MTAFFAGLLAAARRVPLVYWVIAALVLILLGTCTIHRVTDNGKVSRGEVIKDQKARDNASDARLNDAQRRDDNKEKLNEAVASLPDGLPSERRLALECQRMRNDGLTQLPAFCRPAAERAPPPRPG
jgi:hypothetical protein